LTGDQKKKRRGHKRMNRGRSQQIRALDAFGRSHAAHNLVRRRCDKRRGAAMDDHAPSVGNRLVNAGDPQQAIEIQVARGSGVRFAGAKPQGDKIDVDLGQLLRQRCRIDPLYGGARRE
jgi:hypothetical protein